jgi:hypothetical protein
MGDPNEREPCPHRIIDDVGVAFSMGAIGGTFWHAIKGARSSPKGERLYGSVAGVCALENQPSRYDSPHRTVSQFNSSPQPSRATRGGWAAVLQCGEDFFLRMTALLCTLGRRRTRGTPSHRASAPAPRWRFAAVRCPAVLHSAAAASPPPSHHLTPCRQVPGLLSHRVYSAACFWLSSRASTSACRK